MLLDVIGNIEWLHMGCFCNYRSDGLAKENT